MRSLTLAWFLGLGGAALAAPAGAQISTPPLESPIGNPNEPGILDPVLTELHRRAVRVPASYQVANGSELLNIVGTVKRRRAKGEKSATGATIGDERSPNDTLDQGLEFLESAALAANVPDMQLAADKILDVLLGRTSGEIYDGFSLLNHARGGWLADHVPGEYRMKRLTDSGQTTTGLDGQPRKIWEATIQIAWFDHEADCDTYLLVVPEEAHEFDVFHVHYRILSTERGDFAPTVFLNDHRAPGSSGLPFKGFDATWVPVLKNNLTEVTISYPSVGLVRGLQAWDWGARPWRTSYTQIVREIRNAHTGVLEPDPRSRSLRARNRLRDLDGIGASAPEKKIYEIAQAVLGGASPAQVLAAIQNAGVYPFGNWMDWLDTVTRRDRLPPEAWKVLAQEGITPGPNGELRQSPYDVVLAIANDEFYRVWKVGAGGVGQSRPVFHGGGLPGDRFVVKVINLDDRDHHVLIEDYGPALTELLKECHYAPGGHHSLEIFSYKPIFGAPKSAEMQWRLGWGYRPTLDVIEQFDVFPRPLDRLKNLCYLDAHGVQREGWLYPPEIRRGDWRFDPPPEALGTPGSPAPGRLTGDDGLPGVLLGRRTVGYGVAKMCTHPGHPMGEWCRSDRSALNPYGTRNVDTDGDGTPDVLWFPSWLRNPDPAGGDLITATEAFEPFRYLHPEHGGLLVDPNDPAQGWWTDRTFAHGRPVAPGESFSATIVVPRGGPQAFAVSDDLYRDRGVTIIPYEHHQPQQ